MTVPRSPKIVGVPFKTRQKYGNVRVKLDGYSFDSQVEAAEYGRLKLLQMAGEISELKVHPRFPLEVNGKRICVYEGDFSFLERVISETPGILMTFFSARRVVLDVKGFPTPEYKIKRELFRALYPDADFRELNTDKSSTRKAWTKFAATRGAVQTQAGGK